MESNPVKLSGCSLAKAKAGDLDEQMCIAKSYLSKRNLQEADEYMKTFGLDIDRYDIE